MMRATMAALLVHSVRAECPVEPGLVTFCQPEEEKGSYGARHWTLPADRMCRGVGCLTLDDMRCSGGTKDLCLKWGNDAYFGRLTVPEGVIVDCFGSWRCNSQPHSHDQGPEELKNHWDHQWREDAFIISFADGYTCDPTRHPPVQKTYPSNSSLV